MKNKKHLFTWIVVFAVIFTDAGAQDTIPEPRNLPDEPAMELLFQENVDSLLNLYYVNRQMEQVVDDDAFTGNDSLVPDYADSIYIERLGDIPSVINLTFNRLVKNYIDVYTKKRREQVEVMLGMSDYYFPMFEHVFDLYDVPYELKYLAIIESALNPRAVSRVGASGTWQFMYGTGKVYGLTINSLVDERRDPLKATHAAARYLRDLYGIFGDWTLALAAYNCGPGNVSKAIRRSGGKRDFWDIYYLLPRETRGYVPAFIAATYTMNYYEEHNLRKRPLEMELHTDTLMVHDKLHLKQVAEVLQVPVRQLRDLNPQYRHDVIPATGEKGYALTLPRRLAGSFIQLQDSVFAYKDSVYFNPEKQISSPTRVSRNYRADLPSDKYDKLYYSVKSGDNVGYIADWYDVRASDLRYWNNIRRNLIRSGQKLVIYKPKGKGARYSKLDDMSFNEKQRFAGREVSETADAPAGTAEKSRDYLYYTVREGDTLWEIAKKFPGVSDTDIARLNNITNSSQIKPGQTIRIKPES